MRRDALIRIGDWTLDPAVRILTRGDVEKRLEPKMLDVLMVLVESAGAPVRRRDLEDRVWSGAATGTELLSRTIWKLRRALGDDPSKPAYIETIPRVGYRLVAAVGEAAREPAVADPRGARNWRLAAVAALLLVAITIGFVIQWRSDERRTVAAVPMIVPLTATPGYEASPSLSPDGRFVAFQRYDPNESASGWDIAILEIETGATRTFAGERSVNEYSPAWSPSGDSIAFIVQNDTCEVRVQALNGSSVRAAVCAPDQGHEIAWEPNGSLILASSGSGQTLGLTRIDRTSGRTERLTEPPVGFDGDRHPRPSPDGRRLAFVRQRTDGIADVYVIDRGDSAGPERFTFDHRRVGDLAWMPDGSAIVFSSTRGGASQLWRQAIDGGPAAVVPMSGRNADRISIGPDSAIVYEEYFGDSDIWAFDPKTGKVEPWTGSSRSEWGVAVSPDGSTVAFLSDRTGSAEIWTVPYNGGEPRRVTYMDGAEIDPPRWSPDGRLLAFSAAPQGNFDVFTIEPDGGAPVRVTDGVTDERWPVWWRNTLAYTANRTGTPELWAVGADPRSGRRLTSGGASAARVSPDGKTLLFTRPDEPGLWQLSANRAQQRVWSDLHPADWANWVPTDEGVFHLRVSGAAAPQLERIDLVAGRSDTLGIVAEEAPARAGVARAPDGRLLFGRIVRSESDLWIARINGSRTP